MKESRLPTASLTTKINLIKALAHWRRNKLPGDGGRKAHFLNTKIGARRKVSQFPETHGRIAWFVTSLSSSRFLL